MSAATNQRDRMLSVVQLNHAQWHVVDSVGHWGSGVTDWVDAASNALMTARLTGRGVETVDLEHNRLLLLHPECAA